MMKKSVRRWLITYDDEAKMKLSVDKDYGKLYKRKEDSAEKIAQRNAETNPLMYSDYETLQEVMNKVPVVSSDTVKDARDDLA